MKDWTIKAHRKTNCNIMKNPENQPSTSTAQEAHSINAQATPPTLEKPFKKPHLKLFNCLMKPSLSLTSLPPQSPKEAADETQSVERPYNSLKVKNLSLPTLDECFIKIFMLVYFLEEARWRERTLETLMGVSSLHQHNNVSHRNKRWKKRKWLLGSLQLHYGYKSYRLVSGSCRRSQQSWQWSSGRIQSFQTQWRSKCELHIFQSLKT